LPKLFIIKTSIFILLCLLCCININASKNDNRLLEIEASLYPKLSKKKLKGEAIIYRDGKIFSETKQRKNLKIELPLNSEYRIDFLHEGYFTKSYLVDTKNVPEDEDNIELPLKIILTEFNSAIEDSINNLPLEIIKYDVSRGIFDKFQPIQETTKQAKRRELVKAKSQLEIDRLQATTAADSIAILEKESQIMAAENELLLAEKELEIANTQLKSQNLQLKQEKIQRYLLFGGIIVALVFIVLLFFTVKQKKTR
jgi:hypothetical protein